MRKNLLLITADQWRGDCLSALGHPHVKTPNVDALIADSVTFDQHYSVCVPCAPARASLLTGMYLQNHRVTRNGSPLDNRHTNIARELRNAGYTPMLFGYTDTTLDPSVFSEEDVCRQGYEGMMRGFEEGLLLPSENPEKWLTWLREKGYNFESVDEAFRAIESHSNSNKQGRAAQPVSYKPEHSQTAFLTENVIDYIDQFTANTTPNKASNNTVNKNDSWCIHVSYLRPHPPFVAPEPYNLMYDPASFDPPDNPKSSKNDHPWLNAARSPMGDWPEAWMQQLATSQDYNLEANQIRATYYGLITKIDHYVGMLIDHLKKIGEYENTLIIMTSDHGELMSDHGLFGKRGFYKESFHIPLIIRDPNQPKKPREHMRGHIENVFTESVDIMPTVLDWLDCPVPRQCDGKSLLPFIKGEPPENWRKEVHWEYDFRDIRSPELELSLGIKIADSQLNVISDDDYMYVHFTSLPALFFDLGKDPKTQNNVIEKPEYQQLVLTYAQRLLSWRMHNDESKLTGCSVSRDDIFYRNE